MKCKLDTITVHYEAFGEGRPLIALHGLPLDHRCQVSALEPLFERRAGWRRLYPDLPGMGKTPGAGWITSDDHVLEVVLDFIDRVIPGERFVITGQSYGGYLARGVIYHRVEMVDGLLLTVPMIVANRTKRALPPHRTLARDAAFISGLGADDLAVFKEYEGMTVVQERRVFDWLKATIHPAVKAADTAFLDGLQQSENYAFSFDVDALAAPFEKPTLIVLGRQDSIVGYRDAWAIVESYPRATLAVLDRAGHNLEAEQADLYAALVSEWLDRVEESAAD